MTGLPLGSLRVPLRLPGWFSIWLAVIRPITALHALGWSLRRGAGVFGPGALASPSTLHVRRGLDSAQRLDIAIGTSAPPASTLFS